MGCWGCGRPRTFNFHLTGTTAGGAGAVELRVSPRIERPFLIKQVDVIPVSVSTPGQSVDVLVSQDTETDEQQVSPGVSIFGVLTDLSAMPASDQARGLPIGDQPFSVSPVYRVEDTGRSIKVATTFAAPAVSLPECHVVVVIEEFEVMAAPPIEPRPPVVPLPPVVPPVVEPSPPGGVPPVSPAPSPAPTPTPVPRPSSPPYFFSVPQYCSPRDLRAGGEYFGGAYGVCPLGVESSAVVSAARVGLPVDLAGSGALLAQRFTARIA